MIASLTIRRLCADDRVVWEPLWRAYLEFYNTTRSDALFDLTFSRYVDATRADMRGWLAWRDDRAVGLVHVIVHAHGWHEQPVTYLQDLYTAPEARGQGVGRALIEAVYADADAANRREVYWMTQTDNAPARRLYDTLATPTDFMKYARSPSPRVPL